MGIDIDISPFRVCPPKTFQISSESSSKYRVEHLLNRYAGWSFYGGFITGHYAISFNRWWTVLNLGSQQFSTCQPQRPQCHTFLLTSACPVVSYVYPLSLGKTLSCCSEIMPQRRQVEARWQTHSSHLFLPICSQKDPKTNTHTHSHTRKQWNMATWCTTSTVPGVGSLGKGLNYFICFILSVKGSIDPGFQMVQTINKNMSIIKQIQMLS